MSLFKTVFFLSSEDGIGIGRLTFPICLPTSSSDDPKRWENRRVEILGFAASTSDFSNSKGDRMKVAQMDVFTQKKCNVILDQKLEDNKKCKFFKTNDFYKGICNQASHT